MAGTRDNSYGPGFALDPVSQRLIGQELNYTITPTGLILPVSTDNPLATKSVGSAIDANGHLRVSSGLPLYANKNLASRHETRFQEITSGGSETITFNYDTASADLNVGTASGEFAIRQSNRYITYIEGNSDITQVTYIPPVTKANQVLEIGRGDDNDGLFMGRDSLGIYFFIRTSTSGTPVDGAPIRQADWNGDKLDGTGLSGAILDPEAKQLFWVDFLWQGVGTVRFGFLIGNELIICHSVDNANTTPAFPFMRTPTLPIRYKIYNTGTVASPSTLKEICIDVETEGGFPGPGVQWSVANLITTRIAVTTRRPIFAIRFKNTFDGELVRRTFKITDAGFSASGNNAVFEIVHCHDVTATTGAWIDVDATASALEYSRNISAITAADFHTIDHQFGATSVGNSASSETLVANLIDEHSFLSQNFDSTNSQIFAIFATSEASTANCWSHISGSEFE